MGLSGCDLILLQPKGIIASAEKDILITSVLLMLIVVLPVIVLTLTFAWRYREGNTKAHYAPDWAHNARLEIVWWTIPCIIIAVLAVITWKSCHELDPYRPIASKQKTITIQAIALEWKWLFVYPEQNIATVNYVQFPVDVPVKFRIASEGPMNSLQIPQLGGQIYAMDGMKTTLHLLASETGDYRGMSTNFSGDGFSEMNFVTRVSTQQAFDQWVKEVRHAPYQLTMTAYKKLMKPGVEKTRRYYAAVEKDLFNTIVMKSMMPMPKYDIENSRTNQTKSLHSS